MSCNKEIKLSKQCNIEERKKKLTGIVINLFGVYYEKISLQLTKVQEKIDKISRSTPRLRLLLVLTSVTFTIKLLAFRKKI